MGRERELLTSVTLADCEVQTFTAGGPGGQHQNRSQTGVRVIHHPSGARGEARDSRSQKDNKRQAFLRMIDTQNFRYWVRELQRIDRTGMTAEERVAAQMTDDKIRTEIRVDGQWTRVDAVD